MNTAEPSREQLFRDSLRDVIAVLEALLPQCSSVDDLIPMLQLALKNDGQTRLLMKSVTPISKR